LSGRCRNSTDILKQPCRWPTRLLKTYVGALSISTLAIDAEGIIYVGFGNKFYAITPEGKKKWDFTTESFVTSSPAVGPNGTIYFGTLRHRFYALNPNGSVKWTYDLVGAEFQSSPVIGIDGTIYVGTAMASDISGEWPVLPRLLALTPDGEKKWEFLNEPDGIEDDISSTPAIGKDGTIYFGTYDNDVFAVSADGKKKWVFATGDYVHEGAAVGSDNTVYIGSNDETFYAISPDGAKKWSILTGDVTFYPSISSKGIVYVSGKDKLLAVEADGTIKWQIPVSTAGQLAVDGEGTVIFGATDDKIHAVGPDGKELWSLDVGERLVDPAIGADGTVYFVCYPLSRIYAIGRK
jgi:outer membrane protein assembly factor BamB